MASGNAAVDHPLWIMTFLQQRISQMQRPQQPPERVGVDIQLLRRQIVVAAALLPGGQNHPPLAFDHRILQRSRRCGAGAASSTVSGRSSGSRVSDSPSTTARSMAFSSSRTLPGPGIAHQVVSASGEIAETRRWQRALARSRKWRASAGMSVGAIAQRRHAQRHHIQSMVEVFAKRAAPGLRRQIAIGGRDQPDVQLVSARAAHALELALLQHAQQLGLQRRREFADLVEEDRAALRPVPACPSSAPPRR